jgi:hypothetical protein
LSDIQEQKLTPSLHKREEKMGDNKEIKPKDIECKSKITAFERNRYFYGKLLTVRDFEAEQRYFIEKQRLINHLIHGSGVICGLKVLKKGEEPEGEPQLKDTEIRITEGVALDCCGREIVVPKYADNDLASETVTFGGDGKAEVYVLLKYDWCGKEMVPNVSDISSCEETCCYSRIMESYKIEIVDEKPEECASINNEFCTTWANLVANSVKGKYVDLEKKTSKWVTTGEYFNVQLKVKAKVHPMAITIEPSESEEFEIDEKTFPSGAFDFKAGEEKTFVYKVKSLATDEQNLTEGKISAEIEDVSGEEEHDFPPLTINVVSSPDKEKNEAFVNLHQKVCAPCTDLPVVLARIEITKGANGIEVSEIDNATVDEERCDKKLVYSNPRLYELIKCVEQQVELQEPREQKFEKDFPKIKETNWEHNREYDLTNDNDMMELRELMQKCTITFDRDMNKETINHKTLNGILLEYIFDEDYNDCGYVERTSAKSNLPVCFLPEEAGNRVSFTFFPGISNIGNVGYWAVNRMVKTRNQAALKTRATMAVATGEVMVRNAGMRILIQLKGDFIQDKNGNILDPNHIKGELPTGNGAPGGLFESWIDVKMNASDIDNTKNEVNKNPGASNKKISANTGLSENATNLVLRALTDNNVIYSKEGKYYPLPDPIVYDGKYNYLKQSAEKLKADLGNKGITLEMRSSDELTDEDKKNYEIILIRGGEVTETTKERMKDVELKVKSEGEVKITKNPYIKNTNVFIIGGKGKDQVDKAVNNYLKRYTSPEIK